MVQFVQYSAPLPALGTQVVVVILENLSLVMTYAFSQRALTDYYNKRFIGRFKALERSFFDISQERATRAIIELAVMYRALDDIQDITSRREEELFGILDKTDGTTEPLPLRELTNKIIHAANIEWDFATDPERPHLVCHAAANQVDRFKWTKATIPITSLAEACSGFAC